MQDSNPSSNVPRRGRKGLVMMHATEDDIQYYIQTDATQVELSKEKARNNFPMFFDSDVEQRQR